MFRCPEVPCGHNHEPFDNKPCRCALCFNKIRKRGVLLKKVGKYYKAGGACEYFLSEKEYFLTRLCS